MSSRADVVKFFDFPVFTEPIAQVTATSACQHPSSKDKNFPAPPHENCVQGVGDPRHAGTSPPGQDLHAG
jgi:hypothetical protein